MTGFDIAVFLLVGAGAISGFFRGFVEEVLSLAAWIFAVVAIRYMHTPLTDFVQDYVGTPTGASVLAFAILLLIPYAFVKAVAGWAGNASRSSVLGPIDRVLGFGFGAVKGFLITVVGFSILVLGYDTVWGLDGRPHWITQARTYPFVNASSEEVITMIGERRRAMLEAEKAANIEEKN